MERAFKAEGTACAGTLSLVTELIRETERLFPRDAPCSAPHHLGPSAPSFLSRYNEHVESPWLGETEGETGRQVARLTLLLPPMHTSILVRQPMPAQGARKQPVLPPVIPYGQLSSQLTKASAQHLGRFMLGVVAHLRLLKPE